MLIVYYSLTGNVQRLAQGLGYESMRITGNPTNTPDIDQPFILITPTYTDRIPAPVERFLDSMPDLSLCVGVVGSGNKNFGNDYCAAAKNIETQYNIPFIYSLELFGLPQDTDALRELCEKQLCKL